jgi:alanine racemase
LNPSDLSHKPAPALWRHPEAVSSFPHSAGSRPTVVEVDLAALRYNIANIRARVGNAQIMGIVKANAYGHGLIRTAQELVNCGVEQLGVAFVEEGIVLRQNGIRVPILVLGGIIGDQLADFIEHDLMITASSVYKLDLIEDAAQSLGKRAKIHVKIDTGMERLGIHYYNAAQLFEAVLATQHCDLCGVFSHLASSESLDHSFTQLQVERFLEATEWFNKRTLPMPLRHMANSGAILQHPATFFDLVRPGIMTYGVYPDPNVEKTVALQPVLSFKTRVVYFKVVPQGAAVGYNGTWVAPCDTRVVTLPVGYGDGFRRSLSNRGRVLIRGNSYPIVGNVSMDQITVNIGDGTAYNDDEVALIGAQGAECISVEEMANWMDTIPYEVLTGINTRVPRLYRN